MSTISHIESKDLPQAFQLWLQTGWNQTYAIDQGQFIKSWSNAFIRKCIWHGNKMIAIGRANSDGVLYSMIHDIVVDVEHRKNGFGRQIVKAIVDELTSHGIKVIQLMSAKDQSEFYKKVGFSVRAADRPGMQYSG